MSKSLTIKAVITATSNKQDGRFKSDNPRKSIYVVADQENAKQLKEFGLTEYTPKDKEGKPYFIIKASEKMDHYKAGIKVGEVSGTADSINFTSNGEEVHLALFQNKTDLGKVFTRVYAINGTVQQVEQQNPFADLQSF